MSDSTEALQQTGDGAPSPAAFRSAPIEQLTGQVQDIQAVMDDLMKEGTHYDDITGDGRNSLLQPGAEKLCFAFKFAPSFDVDRHDYAPDEVPNADAPVEGHREYVVECTLTHRPTGQYVGSGRGSCSTLESKYRYRKIDETTEVPIPGDFWDSYEDSMANADFSILEEELIENGVDIPEGGEAGVTKNDDGEWRITVQAKGENPDIADLYNTVLKMAEKRALVNAVKRSTAASDIFTQDTEDLQHLDGASVKGARKQAPASQSSNDGDTYNPDGTPDTTTFELPGGKTYNVDPNAAGELKRVHENLQDAEGADLAAMITKCREAYDWPGREQEALETLLNWHEQWLADSEDQAAEEAAAENDDPHAPAPSDDATEEAVGLDACMDRNFADAYADGKEGWEAISEAQLNRLYAIADDEGWDEAALNRLVNDELGWESKADIPYGEVYEEICAALKDERLRYHMSRDPDTPDMFDGEDTSQDANHEAFEDGAEDGELPF
jgi:hypothetical protein